MKDIKIGACAWGLPADGLYSVEVASRLGIEGLSLQIGTFEHNYPLAEPVMQDIYLDKQQQYGVEFIALALNDFDNVSFYAPENTPDGEKAWNILKKAVTTAKRMHIPIVQIPGFNVSEIKEEWQLEVAAARFAWLCDELGDDGITVAAENLMTGAEFKKLYDAVERKNFGAYFDSQNYHLFKGYDEVEILEGLYPYMVPQLHVKDGEVMSGSLLGKGTSDFFRTMEKLGELKYKGYIILENYYDQLPLRLEGKNPYELIEEDLKIVREAISKW